MTDQHLRATALASKAWPFEEARKLLERVKGKKQPVKEILFETGYGPSGLPISAPSAKWRAPPWCATPSRPCRTSRRACCASPTTWTACARSRTTSRTRRWCAQHLGRKLTSIPDPFGKYESFGHHNNAMLRRFLDAIRLRLRVRELDGILHFRPLRCGAPQGARML